MNIPIPLRHASVAFVLWQLATPALACPDCEYEACVFGACACLPKSGCLLAPIPAPIRPPDPGALTEKAKTDPVGALVNPLGVYNRSGIPQPGDIVEFAVRNPDQIISLLDDPRRVLYTPVTAAIIGARNAVINNGGQPIPATIKPFLLNWFPQELIDSVRWTSNWSLIDNTLQAAQMTFNTDTRAIA